LKLKINKETFKTNDYNHYFDSGIFQFIDTQFKIPVVQNFIKDRLVVYLEKKIKTKVSLEKVYVAFPNNLELENFYLKGQDVDTLLAVKKLDVGLNMMKLMNSTADITSVDLEGVKANVVRNPEGKIQFRLHYKCLQPVTKRKVPRSRLLFLLTK
jgi:hypothetical protein